MRRILLDYARKHRAARRGGAGQKVMLEDTMAISRPEAGGYHRARCRAQKLHALDTDQSQVVELRFFGGLSVEETAEVMGISPATVKRAWSSARAFLHREITGGSLDARAMGADSSDL